VTLDAVPESGPVPDAPVTIERSAVAAADPEPRQAPPLLCMVPDAALAACVGPYPRTEPISDAQIEAVAQVLGAPAAAGALRRARDGALGPRPVAGQ
jgi:hypothetical protein